MTTKRVVKATENIDWEITVKETNGRKPIINRRQLFSLRYNVPESSGG